MNFKLNCGFISLILVGLLATTSIGIGAAAYFLNKTPDSLILVEDTLNKADSKTLKLKTLIPITLTPPPIPVTDNFGSCGYSGNGPGLEGVQFDEPTILIDYAPKYPMVAGPTDSIYLWVGDENSIILGISQVDGKTFPISSSREITTVEDPTIGAPYDQGGTDNAGRPIFPALFVSDITTDPGNRSGDWQQGGTPISPHFVSGTWITSVKNGTRTTQGELPTTKNVVNKIWNLAPGGSAPEPGKSYDDPTYYGTEIRWRVSQLLSGGKIQSGRIYRAQFMAHDGDSNSDVAQGCVTIRT